MTPVLYMTAQGSESEAVQALRLGVKDYLKHPATDSAFGAAVARCLGPSGRAASAQDAEPPSSPALVGQSRSIVALREQIENAARCSSTVLITGETGTGKQLVTECIHRNSGRRDKPLISVNCAAIPDTLLESELFGFEKGAFTGAHERRDGKLRQAHGGTILLDEIGEIAFPAQAKLLGFLEDRLVSRLGASAPLSTDVRVVAATNQNLDEAVRRRLFRCDLFYRLNVVRIRIPPVRERREDIPLLLDHLAKELGTKFGRAAPSFDAEALDLLVRHDWPGNVREMRNVVEALFVTRPAEVVRAEDLPDWLSSPALASRSTNATHERDALIEALTATNWNKSRAAERLKWSRMTVYRKMARYSIARGRADMKKNDRVESSEGCYAASPTGA